MIERYTLPAMGRHFGEDAKLGSWLRVEQVHLRVLSEAGIAPHEAAVALDGLSEVDAEAVAAREAEIHHDLAAFVDVAAASAPEAAGWIHYGLTSSDVVDTALALRLRDAARELDQSLRSAIATAAERSREHSETWMLGRTHGMPAEVVSFGGKVAGWVQTLNRDRQRIAAAAREVAVGKLSGAVGTYSGVGPDIEEQVLSELGLGVDHSATQVVQRDRHAALLSALAICASNLDRFATEIRLLQRGDVGEASEPFAAGQKGSSAMPHKRNPITCERITGLARIVRATAQVGLENIVLWHERDISHSSAERVAFADAFVALHYMLDRFTWVMGGLEVHRERMHANIEQTEGRVFSQRVLLALVAAGMTRDVAYRHVQGAAHAPGNFLDNLVSDPVVSDQLGGADGIRTLAGPDALRVGVDIAMSRLDSVMDSLASDT